ncbi:hypothetical protein FBU30_004705 [Linnemannia zychae]|nr:hypothetical protein FBU30_004705 [Linnemannia zychae]
MTKPPRQQSFRRGHNSLVVNIDAYFHEETNQYLVEWSEILEAFPHATCIMNGPNLVSKAKNPKTRKLPFSVGGPGLLVSLYDEGDDDDNMEFTFPSTTIQPPAALLTHEGSYGHQMRLQRGRQVRWSSQPEKNEYQTINGAQIRRTQSVSRRPEYRGTLAALPEDDGSPYSSAGHSISSKSRQDDYKLRDRRTFSPLSNDIGDITESPEMVEASYHPQNRSPSYSPNYQNGPQLTNDMRHVRFASASQAVFKGEHHAYSIQARYFLQRMESAVQLFGQLIANGQLEQAQVVKVESENIKQEISRYYGGLQSEVATNATLQNQMKEIMAAEQQMTNGMHELQEAQLDNEKRMILLQKQILERLALVQRKATAILTQAQELYEFSIPRLFIVLPKEDIPKQDMVSNASTQLFRVYFLCECGEHTKPLSGLASYTSHNVHLAHHDGYDLNRPNEFFHKYGSYVLAILQMLKYGAAAAGMVVSPLKRAEVTKGLEYAEAGLKSYEKDLSSRVDSAIEFLQGLTSAQDGLTSSYRGSGVLSASVVLASASRIDSLKGQDLQHLESFLKSTDGTMVLANLYKIATPQGHVKWVCLDHYRERYGGSAHLEFRKSMELNDGIYNRRTGMVTLRLASPLKARHFYTMLLSTKIIHELELTLDWNTSFEDLRILKDVIQQSSVYHLGLDLCGRVGPTSDFVHRNRRAEPIIQIMASGRVHTMTIKNVTGFLSQTKELSKTMLHIRHFDLREMVGAMDGFSKLEKLIRASLTLTRLSLVVADIDGAFNHLRPFVARHNTLSILDLKLQDGTAASVRFEPGSDMISSVDLKVFEPSSTTLHLRRSPFVTSITYLGSYSLTKTHQLVQTAIKEHRRLKTIEISHLADEAMEKLQGLQETADNYCSGLRLDVQNANQELEATANTSAAPSEPKQASFLDLYRLHRETWVWNLGLLIASVGKAWGSEEAPVGATIGSSTNRHRTKSLFTFPRPDGSIASIRFGRDAVDPNSAIILIDDFDAYSSFQDREATTLTVLGAESAKLLNDMMNAPTRDFSTIRILELGYDASELLRSLRLGHLANMQCPQITRLVLWNTADKTMQDFSLPLRDLNLLGNYMTSDRLPSLQYLLRIVPSLSSMILSVFSLYEVFEIVESSAKYLKTLSKILLIARKSHCSIAFVPGAGIIQSISLCVREQELGKLLSLPKVSELNIESSIDLFSLNKIAPSIFTHYRDLKIFRMDCSQAQVLEALDILNRAAYENVKSYHLVLSEIDANTRNRKERAFDLPLATLRMNSYIIGDQDLSAMESLIRTSLLLQELYITVESIDIAQQIFDFFHHEQRTDIVLSFRLPDDSTAVFSWRSGKEKRVPVVVQMITQPEFGKTFFLPMAELERIDVESTNISITRAVGIVSSVLRRCYSVEAIRFLGFTHNLQDVATVFRDAIQQPSALPDPARNSYSISGDSSKFSRLISELAIYRIVNNTPSPHSSTITFQERLSSVVRTWQGNMLESIGLDWSDPDGITLRLNLAAFDKFDTTRFSNVTELEVAVEYNSKLPESLIRIPVESFSNLQLLEVSCSYSLHLTVLPSIINATSNHPSLKQFKIRHADRSTDIYTYDLPVSTVELTWRPLSTKECSFIGMIIASNPFLSALTLKVSSWVVAFKWISQNIPPHNSLTQLNLHCPNESLLSVHFESDTGNMTSVAFQSAEIDQSVLQTDDQVLALMNLSDTPRYIFRAVQDATIRNPSLKSLTFSGKESSSSLTVKVPFKNVDFGAQPIQESRFISIWRFLAVCPLLVDVQLTVATVDDICQAMEFFGNMFLGLRKNTVLRLRLQDETEASVRFSIEDSSVESVALSISNEYSVALATIPQVRKIIIRPKPTSFWQDAEYVSIEISKILAVFSKVETLVLDYYVSCLLPLLRFLQDLTQSQPSSPFRRFRHRESYSSSSMITYDLPFRTLELKKHSFDWNKPQDLEKLLRSSPFLTEFKITAFGMVELERYFDKLKGLLDAHEKVETVTVKAFNGHLTWRRRRVPRQDGKPGDHILQDLELYVSGAMLPSKTLCRRVSALIILPSYTGNTDDKMASYTRIHEIMNEASQELLRPKHLTLACPIDLFFGHLSNGLALCRATYNLQHPTNNSRMISITAIPTVVVTFHVHNIADEDLITTFGSLFPNCQLQAEVIQQDGSEPRIGVSIDRLGKAKGPLKIVDRVVWDTSNVPGRRIFELLDKMSNRSNTGSHIPMRLSCRTVGSPDASEPGSPAEQIQPYPIEILRDSETAAALVKLLVRRATAFDIEYATMRALVPFVKAEINQGFNAFAEEPFSLLQKYDIRVPEEPKDLESVLLEFDLLIPRQVEHTIHDVSTA